MQGCSPGAFVSVACVLPKISFLNIGNVHLGKLHWAAVCSRFTIRINFIYENTHPLFTSTVSVYGAAPLPGAFDFYSFCSMGYAIIWVLSAQNKIRMTIKVSVRNQGPRKSR